MRGAKAARRTSLDLSNLKLRVVATWLPVLLVVGISDDTALAARCLNLDKQYEHADRIFVGRLSRAELCTPSENGWTQIANDWDVPETPVDLSVEHVCYVFDVRVTFRGPSATSVTFVRPTKATTDSAARFSFGRDYFFMQKGAPPYWAGPCRALRPMLRTDAVSELIKSKSLPIDLETWIETGEYSQITADD